MMGMRRMTWPFGDSPSPRVREGMNLLSRKLRTIRSRSSHAFRLDIAITRDLAAIALQQRFWGADEVPLTVFTSCNHLSLLLRRLLRRPDRGEGLLLLSRRMELVMHVWRTMHALVAVHLARRITNQMTWVYRRRLRARARESVRRIDSTFHTAGSRRENIEFWLLGLGRDRGRFGSGLLCLHLRARIIDVEFFFFLFLFLFLFLFVLFIMFVIKGGLGKNLGRVD
jgi:hypothetical protein